MSDIELAPTVAADAWESADAAERRQAIAALREALPRLVELGINRIDVPYDGYGDSGTVDEPVAWRGEDPVDLPDELGSQLVEAVETLFPWGWENNAGAFGKFELSVADRTLVRQHNWRIEDVEYDEETIEL